jgi:hypothetical protein
MTEPRWNLIRRIREQIAAGTYETNERLRRCADKLNADLTGQPESYTVAPYTEAAEHDSTDHLPCVD